MPWYEPQGTDLKLKQKGMLALDFDASEVKCDELVRTVNELSKSHTGTTVFTSEHESKYSWLKSIEQSLVCVIKTIGMDLGSNNIATYHLRTQHEARSFQRSW